MALQVSGVVGRADVLACILFLSSLILYCSSTRDVATHSMTLKVNNYLFEVT